MTKNKMMTKKQLIGKKKKIMKKKAIGSKRNLRKDGCSKSTEEILEDIRTLKAKNFRKQLEWFVYTWGDGGYIKVNREDEYDVDWTSWKQYLCRGMSGYKALEKLRKKYLDY